LSASIVPRSISSSASFKSSIAESVKRTRARLALARLRRLTLAMALRPVFSIIQGSSGALMQRVINTKPAVQREIYVGRIYTSNRR